MALGIPSAYAAGIELIPADREKYREAADLIQTWDGGDQLRRAFEIIAGIGQRNPKSAHALAALGEIKYRLLGEGQAAPGEVLEIATRAVKIDPDNADAQVLHAKILLHEDHVDDAARAARRAIELAPDKPEAMFVMAGVARQGHLFAEAEDWYRKSIDRLGNPRRKANVYAILGEMLKAREPLEVEKTATVLVTAANLYGDSIPDFNEAAIFLMAHTERYDEAIALIRKALQISDYDLGRQNLGLLQYYKWGHSIYHPEKYVDAQEKPWDPDRITRETGLSRQFAFAHHPLVDGTPYATLAMLKLGMIKDIDAFPENCECPDNALLAAAHGDHPDVVRLLVERGADVNVVDRKYGATVLLYAVRFRHPDLAEYLIKHGARVNHEDRHGILILEYAIVDAKPDDAGILRLLLDSGGDAQAVNRKGSPLLGVAVQAGNPGAVKLLLERYRTDPDARYAGGRGEPVLARAALAATSEGKQIVKLLLDAGANPWVRMGGVDLVGSLERSMEAFPDSPDLPPRIREAQQRMRQANRETIAMLKAAREKTPKPAKY
jgi:tetratricopeptide (TPR) repeat protein